MNGGVEVVLDRGGARDERRRPTRGGERTPHFGGVTLRVLEREPCDDIAVEHPAAPAHVRRGTVGDDAGRGAKASAEVVLRGLAAGRPRRNDDRERPVGTLTVVRLQAQARPIRLAARHCKRVREQRAQVGGRDDPGDRDGQPCGEHEEPAAEHPPGPALEHAARVLPPAVAAVRMGDATRPGTPRARAGCASRDRRSPASAGWRAATAI